MGHPNADLSCCSLSEVPVEVHARSFLEPQCVQRLHASVLHGEHVRGRGDDHDGHGRGCPSFEPLRRGCARSQRREMASSDADIEK